MSDRQTIFDAGSNLIRADL